MKQLLTKVRIIPILNILCFTGLFIMNFLAARGPYIGNVRTADVSAEYNSIITPNGWAFSIWGLIYTYLATIVLVNFVQSFLLGRNNRFINDKMFIFLPMNMLFNSTWFFPWHYSTGGRVFCLWIAALVIILMLSTLIIMYVRVGVHYLEPTKLKNVTSAVSFQNDELSSSSSEEEEEEESNVKFWNFSKTIGCNIWEYWLIQPFISLYMGWITVATTLNLTLAITYQWPSKDQTLWGWAHSSWACFLIGIIVCMGLVFLSLRRDFFYASVLAWALFAIADKQKSTSDIVHNAAFMSACILVASVLFTIAVTVKDYIVFYGGVSGTVQHVKKSFRKSFPVIGRMFGGSPTQVKSTKIPTKSTVNNGRLYEEDQ